MQIFQLLQAQLGILFLLIFVAGLAMLVVWVSKNVKKANLHKWVLAFLIAGILGILANAYWGYYMFQGMMQF